MTQQDYQNAVGMAKFYSHMYYVKSSPVISDAEFDALITSIEQAEQQHPEWTLPDSPTQQVGSDLSGSNGKIAHRTPMLSCQKAQSLQEVQKWVSKTEKAMNVLTNDENHTGGYNFVLMWKYDGISCSLVYQDGLLISAATRGNGKLGQDITAHARCIPSIPQELFETGRTYSLRGRIEVRGEIVCRKKNLVCLSQTYTDCRTAASSLCNQSVPDENDLAMLDFVPWAADIDDAISRQQQFHCTPFGYPWHKFDFLGRFFVNRPSVFNTHGYDGIAEHLANMENLRSDFPFPVDGVVIRIMHDDYFNRLGFTAHHPKGNIAYKFAPAKAITVCTRIEVTTGATGKRTPVAYFQPVTILGREVSSASLYSEKCARDLGIAPGSTIEVGLSNDVTPKVYRVIDSSEITDTPAPASSTSPSSSVSGDTIAAPSPLRSLSGDSIADPSDKDSADSPVSCGSSAARTVLHVATTALSCALVLVTGLLAITSAVFGLPLLGGSFRA